LIFSESLKGGHGEAMFRHACALGLEGVIFEAVGQALLLWPLSDWRKVKNAAYQRRVGTA
jgi:hypothetical protein